MKIVKTAMYSCKELPKGKSLVIMTDNDGFLWALPIIRLEGFTTPYITIEEVCFALNLSEPVLLWERIENIEI